MGKKRRRSKDIEVLKMPGLGTAVVVPKTKRGRTFTRRTLAGFSRLGSMVLAYTEPKDDYQILRSLDAVLALADLHGVTYNIK